MKLVCPRCRHGLTPNEAGSEVVCQGDDGHCYPLLNGIPVLINDENSVFSTNDFIEENMYRNHARDSSISAGLYEGKSTLDKLSYIRRIYRRFALRLTNFRVNTSRITGDDAFSLFEGGSNKITVLVIGAGEWRYDIENDSSLNNRNMNIEFIYTDVTFSEKLLCICDAHDIPFENEVFDLVMAVAVLEHVADPYTVVKEIHRVLKKEGYVYATTPFLQPVHMGAYDFTRFTLVGYRRLFRCFEEIRIEPVLGPGSSFAYAIQHFLPSFSSNHKVQSGLRLLGLLLSRPFKYLDKVLLKQRSAVGYAAGYGFIGKKSESILTDRELVTTFSNRT